MSEKEKLPPRPSATILLLRDGPSSEEQLEVFMVVRHHQIDFASGALVFPGGKTAPGDRLDEVRALCDGVDGLSDDILAIRVAAIREAFEEAGVLLARNQATGELISGAQVEELDDARPKLDSGELSIGDFLRDNNLRLACDMLVPFAHWITPEFMPKRFDTHFFIAQAPGDHIAVHDGSETVDSVWSNPNKLLREAADGQWTIIFPTRLNVEKLGKANSVSEAIDRANAKPVVTVLPQLIERDGNQILQIPAEADYSVVEETLEAFASSFVKKD